MDCPHEVDENPVKKRTTFNLESGSLQNTVGIHKAVIMHYYYKKSCPWSSLTDLEFRLVSY